MAKSIYIHEEYTHDLNSPRQIVPLLIDLFKPESVVDVGCGIGTFLYCFKENRLKKVMGIDGKWADKNLLKKYLSENEFIERDLTKPLGLSQSYDLVMCLEVAEHLPLESAADFIKELTRLGNIIIFSAAIPGQGGQHHLNEQWTGFWQQQFRAEGFHFYDILRPSIWDNEKIHWWYRQNIFVVMHDSIAGRYKDILPEKKDKLPDYIHPGLLKTRLNEISMIENGKYPLRSYIKFIGKKLLSLK